MSAEIREEIASYFAELQDPRQPMNQAHLFMDILVISICAIFCGADDWEEVNGCIVTVDALGCQSEVAQTILERGGDYLLALKANHHILFGDLEFLFADLGAAGIHLTPPVVVREVNKDHGRIEIHQAWVITDPEIIRPLQGSEKWPKLCAIIKI